MGQGFTQNLGGLATRRALMGFFESGFVPGNLLKLMASGVLIHLSGCAYLIGSYYKRHEFLFRHSIFSVLQFLLALSVEYSTCETVYHRVILMWLKFLAYLLAKMEGVGGYEGWRW